MPTNLNTLSDLFDHPTVILEGFDGPVYNEFTDIISKLYTGVGTEGNGFWFQRSPLEEIGKKFDPNFEIIAYSDFNLNGPSFIMDDATKQNNARISTLKRSPGGEAAVVEYTRAGMFFNHLDGKIAVFLPLANRGKQRSIGVFTHGNISPENLEIFLKRLAQTITEELAAIHAYRVNKMGRLPDKTKLQKLWIFLEQLTEKMTKELSAIHICSDACPG